MELKDFSASNDFPMIKLFASVQSSEISESLDKIFRFKGTTDTTLGCGAPSLEAIGTLALDKIYCSEGTTDTTLRCGAPSYEAIESLEVESITWLVSL